MQTAERCTQSLYVECTTLRPKGWPGCVGGHMTELEADRGQGGRLLGKQDAVTK
jgi:hypothetical protein